jgi:hypothetical protein
MRCPQAVLSKELDPFTNRLLIFLQLRFASLLLRGMLRYGSPGLSIEGIGVGLNFLDVIVRVEGGLRDLEMLNELQRDSVWTGIEAVGSSVTNGQLSCEDRLDAMADDLQLASIDCQNNSDISCPQSVVILTIRSARECAPGVLFVPTDGGWGRGFSFVLVAALNGR